MYLANLARSAKADSTVWPKAGGCTKCSCKANKTSEQTFFNLLSEIDRRAMFIYDILAKPKIIPWMGRCSPPLPGCPPPKYGLDCTDWSSVLLLFSWKRRLDQANTGGATGVRAPLNILGFMVCIFTIHCVCNNV